MTATAMDSMDNDNANNDSGNDDNDNGSSGGGGGRYGGEGGGRHATAAANGMVWGRCQVARGGQNGNKEKWEHCGYDR